MHLLTVIIKITSLFFMAFLLAACSFTPTEKSQIVSSFTSPFVQAGQLVMGSAGAHSAQTVAQATS